MIGRREFISLAARAQQPAMPVTGVLISYSLDRSGQRLLSAFREGLKASGYEEGRNVAIEYRSAEDQYGRLPALAVDFQGLHVKRVSAAYSVSER